MLLGCTVLCRQGPRGQMDMFDCSLFQNAAQRERRMDRSGPRGQPTCAKTPTSARLDRRRHYASTGASNFVNAESNFVNQYSPAACVHVKQSQRVAGLLPPLRQLPTLLASITDSENSGSTVRELRKNWQPTLPVISTTCSLMWLPVNKLHTNGPTIEL